MSKKKAFGSIIHPGLNNPDVHWSAEIVARDFPAIAPIAEPVTLTEQAGIEVAAFADALGLPAASANMIVSQAVMYWFDHHAGSAILAEEKVQEWLAADSRRTRAGYARMKNREFAAKHKAS